MGGRFTLLAGLGLVAAAGCNRWVDYSGGTKLVYQIVAQPGNDPADDPLIAKSMVTTIQNRLDLYGAHCRIAAEGNDRIVVQFPVPMNSPHLEDLRRQVEAVGKLEFVLVAPDSEQTAERVAEVEAEEQKYLDMVKAWTEERRKFQANPRAGGMPAGEFTVPRPSTPPFVARVEAYSEEVGGATRIIVKPHNRWGNPRTVLQNESQYQVSGMYLTRASPTVDENGKPAVSFGLNSDGARKLGDLTSSNKNRLLAIVFDDLIREQAKIKSRISDQGQLTGNFTQQDVRSIVNILRGGSLPAQLKLLEETAIPPR